jgi:hypothetical protein
MADFEIGQRIYIKWCFQLIERLADLERQLAEAKKLAPPQVELRELELAAKSYGKAHGL